MERLQEFESAMTQSDPGGAARPQCSHSVEERHKQSEVRVAWQLGGAHCSVNWWMNSFEHASIIFIRIANQMMEISDTICDNITRDELIPMARYSTKPSFLLYCYKMECLTYSSSRR